MLMQGPERPFGQNEVRRAGAIPRHLLFSTGPSVRSCTDPCPATAVPPVRLDALPGGARSGGP